MKTLSQLTSDINGSERTYQLNMDSNRLQIKIKPMNKPKRFRSAFTTEQINFLELQFKKFPYISSEHRAEIANALNMQERAIKIWFQNRRMKEKREINTKECNDEINNVKQFGKYQLHNVCTLPSANGHLSHSLPANTHTSSGKAIPDNAFTVQNDNNKLIRAKSNQIQSKQSTYPVQLPIVGANHHISYQNKVPTARFLNTDLLHNKLVGKEQFNTIAPTPRTKKSATYSNDMCRKMKKNIYHSTNIDHKTKIRKLESGHLASAAKSRTAPVDLSSKKKRLAHTPQKPLKQTNIGNSAYYPITPTVYAHPFMPSGGMILRPVNVLPVISPGAAMNVQNNPQTSCCSCNCHGNTQPYTVPPGPINPYTQYVITSPFQNQS